MTHPVKIRKVVNNLVTSLITAFLLAALPVKDWLW